MRQIKSVKDKLRLQLNRVTHEITRKFKPKKSEQESRELTNQQIDWMALTYTTSGKIPDEYGLDATEWFNDRVSRLSEDEMNLFKLKFVDGKSLRDIGEVIGRSKTHVDHLLHLMYEKLKA